MKDEKIVFLKLQNASGAYVEVCNRGAALVSMVVPDSRGMLENIVLRYDKPEQYFSDAFYLGSTIGRFANRIAKAQFELNGKTCFLDKNDGKNSNHGGFSGFHSKLFDYEEKNGKIRLSCFSPDGEGGFLGNLHLSVEYSFSDANELWIEYKAISDKTTLFNPTSHAYFNLSGGKTVTVLDHELKVYAADYLEANDEFLPTGKILPAANSAFDFRDFQKISALMPLKKEILPGYNTYFIASACHCERSGAETRNPLTIVDLKHLASLQEFTSGRRLDVYSDMPGIQIYTGDYLSAPFYPFAGVALEAQFYPDAPNHAHFPACVLEAGQETRYRIRYVNSLRSVL